VEAVNLFVHHGSRDLVAEMRCFLVVLVDDDRILPLPRANALLLRWSGQSGGGLAGMCCCWRGARPVAGVVVVGGRGALLLLRIVVRAAVVVDSVLDSAVTLSLVATFVVVLLLLLLPLVPSKNLPCDAAQRVIPIRLGYQLMHRMACQKPRRVQLWVGIELAVAGAS
jgi:hypothetical protein